MCKCFNKYFFRYFHFKRIPSANTQAKYSIYLKTVLLSQLSWTHLSGSEMSGFLPISPALSFRVFQPFMGLSFRDDSSLLFFLGFGCLRHSLSSSSLVSASQMFYWIFIDSCGTAVLMFACLLVYSVRG